MAPVSLENPKEAEVDATVPEGPLSIVVSGGVVSGGVSTGPKTPASQNETPNGVTRSRASTRTCRAARAKNDVTSTPCPEIVSSAAAVKLTPSSDVRMRYRLA